MNLKVNKNAALNLVLGLMILGLEAGCSKNQSNNNPAPYRIPNPGVTRPNYYNGRVDMNLVVQQMEAQSIQAGTSEGDTADLREINNIGFQAHFCFFGECVGTDTNHESQVEVTSVDSDGVQLSDGTLKTKENIMNQIIGDSFNYGPGQIMVKAGCLYTTSGRALQAYDITKVSEYGSMERFVVSPVVPYYLNPLIEINGSKSYYVVRFKTTNTVTSKKGAQSTTSSIVELAPGIANCPY